MDGGARFACQINRIHPRSSTLSRAALTPPATACAYEIESEIKARAAINHTRHLFGTPACSNNFGQTRIMKS
jgi:hypothetical protein